MIPTALEEALLKQARGLSEEAVCQLIDFARFLRHKQLATAEDDISDELKHMSAEQRSHLEKELENYQQMYPREDE